MRESMRQQFPLVRDVFRRFDSDHDGVLTLTDFKKAIAKFGFQLTDEEATILMKHFDKRQDGQVSYNEFCDALLDEDYTTEMMKTKAALDNSFDANYANRVLAKCQDREETACVRKAVRELGDVIYKRHGLMFKLFREFE